MMMKLRRKTDVQWNTNHIAFDYKTANQTYRITEEDELEVYFLRFIDRKVLSLFPISYEELDEIIEIKAFSVDLENQKYETLKTTPCNSMYQDLINFSGERAYKCFLLSGLDMVRTFDQSNSSADGFLFSFSL